MTLPNILKPAEDLPQLPTEPSQKRPSPASRLKLIFVGPNGLRAGWRLLMFAALVVVLLGGFVLIRNGGLQGFREAQRHAGQITVTPLLMGGSEAIAFVLLCVATLIMGKLEHRKFNEYGLPPVRPWERTSGSGFSRAFWRSAARS
jgi:hypothetical protein